MRWTIAQLTPPTISPGTRRNGRSYPIRLSIISVDWASANRSWIGMASVTVTTTMSRFRSRANRTSRTEADDPSVVRIHAGDPQSPRPVEAQVLGLTDDGTVQRREHQCVVQQHVEGAHVARELRLPECGLAHQNRVVIHVYLPRLKRFSMVAHYIRTKR